jgi:rare lipoprotein A
MSLKKVCLVLVLIFSTLFVDAQKDSLYKQTGMASYYAHKFHGRKTASGEIFSKDSLTAAHKTLPFGTRIRVTNLKNNQSVIVRVNDRGMKGTNRIVDLSPAAAKQIDMIRHGLLKVRVEELPE